MIRNTMLSCRKEGCSVFFGFNNFNRYSAASGLADVLESQVTASMDARILVWDLKVHTIHKALKGGHNKGVYSLAYIPSQRYLISAGYDKYCKVGTLLHALD